MDYSRLQSQTPYAAPRQTVLLVDDDTDLRDAMAVLLEAEGYGVVDASNGKDALAYLRAGPDIAAIILDLAMPVMNGWQFLAERQASPVLARIPTIVVTGISDATKRRKELGNLPVFTKPIHFDELFSALRQALKTGTVTKPNVLEF
jgi:CheY-like chemotaxis protein